MNEPTMLILIAHGSNDARWRESVERLVESVQADTGANAVQLAYMECTPPTLDDVVAHALARDIRQIRVLPLFLTGEGHVERDIQPLVEQAARAHPQAALELLPPIGQHPWFRDVLCEIAAGE